MARPASSGAAPTRPLVAHAIVTGLLPRETIPAELLAVPQPIMAVYEREQEAESDLDGLTACPCCSMTSRGLPPGAGRG